MRIFLLSILVNLSLGSTHALGQVLTSDKQLVDDIIYEALIGNDWAQVCRHDGYSYPEVRPSCSEVMSLDELAASETYERAYWSHVNLRELRQQSWGTICETSHQVCRGYSGSIGDECQCGRYVGLITK